jgi:hypothetical protein
MPVAHPVMDPVPVSTRPTTGFSNALLKIEKVTLLWHDPGSATPSASAAVNKQARVVLQHAALGVRHEVFVDGSRFEHGNLLMLALELFGVLGYRLYDHRE